MTFLVSCNDAAVGTAQVVEGIAAVDQLLVATEDSAALAAGQGLAILEAEAAQVAERPDLPALPLPAMRFASPRERLSCAVFITP